MTREVTNHADVIDSRDIIERLEELEGDREALVEAVTDAEQALSEWDASDDAEELKTLKALADEADGCMDWGHGETLVRDSYFKDYAQELADDIGAIPKDLSWPCSCIDWDQAARELQMDYTSVDFGGVTYWIRS